MSCPREGAYQGSFDLIIASQPYRARTTAEHKVKTVIQPLARMLASGGRLLGIHAYGRDPGIEIIRNLWPDEDPLLDRSARPAVRSFPPVVGAGGPGSGHGAYG